ncbi:mdm2-binding protein-like [Diadema antillarum]|uniref:mdm2-binding protein-like n=1 Tax=Diadema antillarum TaxID=105358 RepID=UPI003A87C8AA
MDSFTKCCQKTPRYVVVVCAEWLSEEDVSLLQRITSPIFKHGAACKSMPRGCRHGNMPGSSRQSSITSDENLLHPGQQSGWISIIAPKYHGAESTDAVFTSGWRRVPPHGSGRNVHGEGPEERSRHDETDTGRIAFALTVEQFDKERKTIEPLPASKMREYAGMVASELDRLADELPAGGFLLDVVWLMPTSTDFPLLEAEDVYLFSVLRRLEVWHGARLTTVLGQGVEGDNHPSLALWKKFLDLQVIQKSGNNTGSEEILSNSASLAWHGQIQYLSSRGTSFLPWPDFCMHQLRESNHITGPLIEMVQPKSEGKQEMDDSQQSTESSQPLFHDLRPGLIVDQTMEFIDQCDMDKIPSWFMLPGKFELRVKDRQKKLDFSRSLYMLRYIAHQLPAEGKGFICQLSCLELDGPPPTAASQGRSSEAWKEAVISDPINPAVPGLHLKGTKHTFFFLVHGDRRGRCIALPLVPPLMLNGAAHAMLASHDTEEQSTQGRDAPQSASEVLATLPNISGRQLRAEEEDLARMQIKALVMVIEKIKSEGHDIHFSPAHMIFIFNYMRKVYYEGHDMNDAPSAEANPSQPIEQAPDERNTAGGSGGEAPAETDEQSETDEHSGSEEGEMPSEPETLSVNHLRHIPTELDQNPSQWVERQALQNQESIANRLRRLGSTDMMLAGIAVPPRDDNTITLSAKEFLKHFKPNGQPRRSDLVLGRPAGVKQSPRTRSGASDHQPSGLSMTELMEADFKKAIKMRYHGIYYCIDAQDAQGLDRRLVRLQQRCVRHEMASSFTSHRQPTIAIGSKRPRCDSDGDRKAKVRKVSPSSAARKLSVGSRQFTPRKSASSRAKATTTPRKGAGSTPRQTSKYVYVLLFSLPPRPKRTATPSKSAPEVLVSPRRSARKLSKDQLGQPSTSTASSSTHASLTMASTKSSSALTPLPVETRQPTSKRLERGAKDASSSRRSSSTSESRSEKHKRKLRSIVEESLKARGISPDHACFKQCVTRLYTQTKMYVKDLKTSKGLYEEMRKISEANADFVISFELKRVTPKTQS